MMAGTVKGTKGEMAAITEKALGELEAARELLAAIAAVAEVPTPDYRSSGEHAGAHYRLTLMGRLTAIKVHLGTLNQSTHHVDDYRFATQLLHEARDRPLRYQPYVDADEQPELAEATQ